MTLPFPRAAPGPSFRFAVARADHDPQAAGPTLRLHTTITETTGTRVHALALRAQIRLEPAARRYSPDQQERLVELFGDPSRWGRTLNPMQLATVSTVTPSFSGEQEVVFEVPLTFDTDVATTRYFRGVGDEGDAPMRLLFSGTVFYEAPSGRADRARPVALGGHVPAAGRRVDGHDGRPPARDGVAAAPRAHARRAQRVARGAGAADLGADVLGTPRRPQVTSHDRTRPPRPRRRDRRRRAVRGLPALPLPCLGAEERAALAVRGARAAGGVGGPRRALRAAAPSA